MDLKSLLCNSESLMEQDMCPRSPMSVASFMSSSSSESDGSRPSTPSLSTCSSSFSSPSTMYLTSSAADSPLSISHMATPPPPVAPRVANASANGTTTQSRTPWTPEEDFLLQKGYSQGLSWALISSTYLPHRSRGCCWGRFKTLQAKVSEYREWTGTEDHLLLLAIKKHDRLFKQAWKAVARELGGDRSWRECDARSSKLSRSMIRKQRRVY